MAQETCSTLDFRVLQIVSQNSKLTNLNWMSSPSPDHTSLSHLPPYPDSSSILVFQFKAIVHPDFTMPSDNYGNKYTHTGSGTNSQGNHWCSRDYGSGASNQNSYHYSNQNGSYYYSNPNGSTYYNPGNGGSATYTPPSGNGGAKSQGSGK